MLPSKKARVVPVNDFSNVLGILPMAQNIYFSPGICAEEKNQRWSNADIIGISALWADIDIYNPGAHVKQNLPQNLQEALTLVPYELPP
jgi:hypothetical protein